MKCKKCNHEVTIIEKDSRYLASHQPDDKKCIENQKVNIVQYLYKESLKILNEKYMSTYQEMYDNLKKISNNIIDDLKKYDSLKESSEKYFMKDHSMVIRIKDDVISIYNISNNSWKECGILYHLSIIHSNFPKDTTSFSDFFIKNGYSEISIDELRRMFPSYKI